MTAAAALLVLIRVLAAEKILAGKAYQSAWVALVLAEVSALAIAAAASVLVGLGTLVPGSPVFLIASALALVPAAFWVRFVLCLYTAVTGRRLFGGDAG